MKILQSWNALLFVIFALSTVCFFMYYTARNSEILKTQRRSFTKEQAEKTIASYEPSLRDAMTASRTVHCDEVTEIKYQVHAGGLSGKMKIDTGASQMNYWNDIGEVFPVNQSLTYMGKYTTKYNHLVDDAAVIHGPRDSNRVQRIAVIIPFRDRHSHLRIFLGHILPVLRRQGNTFSIFVVEQAGADTFNKGRLMNSGFKYARTVGNKLDMPFDCFIFQDVDTLIENDNLLYRCTKRGLIDHLSTSINKFGYNPLCCGMTVGGVLAMTPGIYELLNGFPNSFWGWGGEDDAFNARIKKKGLTIVRPNAELGRFTMIHHGADSLNPHNGGRLPAVRKSTDALEDDGLTNLDTSVEEVWMYATFVKVRVNVGTPPK